MGDVGWKKALKQVGQAVICFSGILGEGAGKNNRNPL